MTTLVEKVSRKPCEILGIPDRQDLLPGSGQILRSIPKKLPGLSQETSHNRAGGVSLPSKGFPQYFLTLS